jgi:hypothetical protein
MSFSLASFVRERLEAEIMLTRQRDALLADFLNSPVLTSAPEEFRLRVGSDLSPARGLEKVLRGGWSFPEHWGIWSRGARSVLHLSFDHDTTFPVTVEVNLEAFIRPSLTQSVAISVNGRRVAMLEFEPSSPGRVETIEIHSGDLSPGVSAEIAFDIANPTAPAEVERSADYRKLGVAIRRLRVLG